MRKRKIKFPLVLKDDVKVRTLEDMRLYFDLEKILAYFENGKLEVWLHDRYEDDIAERVSNIDKNSPDVIKLLCEALGTTSETNSDITMEKVRQKNDKLSRVRQITDEIEVINHYNQVAFSQKELDEILAEGEKTVYLYGDKFTILPDRENVKYIGLSKSQIDFAGHKLAEYRKNRIELISLNLKGNYPWGSDPKVGDEFEFGKYNVQPIKWMILDVKGDNALVITKEIIEYLEYDDSGYRAWSSCSLHDWLNSYFIDSTHFDKDELDKIFFESKEDKVRILTNGEAKKYFRDPKSRMAAPNHAIKKDTSRYVGFYGTIANTIIKNSFNTIIKDSSWWLQDSEGSSAFYVDNNGGIPSFGNSKNERLGVRPVMRVKL